MKMKYLNIVLVATIFFTGISCGKKIVPAMTVNKQTKSYNEASFNSLYVEAIKQKLMGNKGDALKYLELCTKINPSSDAAYYEMAQIVVSNGDIKNGEKYALKAFSINEKNLWYLMLLSELYYQEKNRDSTIIYYEKAVKYFPDNENVQITLGNLYSENRNFDKAITIFDAFDKKYGVNESSTIFSIKNLISAKKYDEALIKIQLLLQQKPDDIVYNGLLAEIYIGKSEKKKAFDVYNTLIDRDPDNAQVQLSFCEFLLSEKNYDELFRILNKIILNDNVTKEKIVLLFAKIIETPDLISDKHDDLMISILLLEATYSDDDIIPMLRPELLIKQGKLSDAALRLEDIIKLKPENYNAWEKLLLVYMQMGDFDSLVKRGEECAARFNMSYIAKILYANGALETGKFQIALEELRKAEILAGDNKDNMVQVLTMRADVYYRMKEYGKSFEVFEQALKYNSEDLTVINNYAYYLAEQDIKLKEAEKMARKVIETEKDNTTYLDTYGWILFKRGKLSEAAKIMESIINSGQKPDAEWYEHYGYILKKQRKCPKAIESWNFAIKLDSTKTYLVKEIENCRK